MVTTKPKPKGPPPNMEVPPEIQLKPSGVDPERIGIWCKSPIKCGKKFGPFMGNRVQEATDDMDPSFVWEIVDLETKEFLFYIDSTDEDAGNWMRYINCARYFEEQNIVSEQEGVDIIYRAIKDIYPEEEILTWYERAPLRKKKGRKPKKAQEDANGDVKNGVAGTSSKPSVVSGKPSTKAFFKKGSSKTMAPPSKTLPDNTKQKKRDGSVSSNSEGVESTKSVSKPKQINPSAKQKVDTQAHPESDPEKDMHTSQRGRRRKVTKYWEMENSDEDEDGESSDDENDSVPPTPSDTKSIPDDVQPPPSDDEWKTDSKDTGRTSPKTCGAPGKGTGEYYQFELKPWHIVKSKVGRKVFKCDICSSVYRQSFSLKRHYIRNHVNYKYVSPTDLFNCCVTSKTASSKVGILDTKEIKQEQDSESVITDTIKDEPIEDMPSKEYPDPELDSENVVGGETRTSSPSLDSEISGYLESAKSGQNEKIGNTSQDKDISNEDCSKHATATKKMDGDVEKCETLNISSEKKSPDTMLPDNENIDIQPDHADTVSDSSSEKSHSSSEKYHPESDGFSDDKTNCKSVPHIDKVVDSPNLLQKIEDNTPGKRVVTEIENIQDESRETIHVSNESDVATDIEEDIEEKMESGSDISSENDGDNIKESVEKTEINEIDDHDDTMETKSVCEGISTSKSEDESEHSGDQNDKPDSDLVASSESKTEASQSGAEVTDNLSQEKNGPMLGLFRCNVCEKLFDTVPLLKEHLANHPEASDGRKTFACEKCDMKFAHKQNLMRHQAVHTGTKPYTCSYCDKRFPTSTNLRRHERVHQGKRFSCPHCPSTFTQTGDLKKHARKIHPELFHECAFCTRYFVKQKLLVEHLQESHEGRTMEENDLEIEAKNEAFRFDLQQDKTESMRLAKAHGKNKLGPKFACTVCRKRFVDYANMCRHRRLAHQRPIFVPPIRDDNGDIVDDTASPHGTTCKRMFDLEDESQSLFFATVADKISENLQDYIEGRQEQLKKTNVCIKWKSTGASSGDASSSKAKTSHLLHQANYNLQDFNFPQGFKLKDISSGLKSVPYSIDGQISFRKRKSTTSISLSGNDTKQEKDSNTSQSSDANASALLQFLQNDISSVSQSMTSTSILAKTDLHSPSHPEDDGHSDAQKSLSPKYIPIRVPQVKTCKICRCIFHNHTFFQSHMLQKHRVHIMDEVPSEDFRTQQHSAHQQSNGIGKRMTFSPPLVNSQLRDNKLTPRRHSWDINNRPHLQQQPTIKFEPPWQQSSQGVTPTSDVIFPSHQSELTSPSGSLCVTIPDDMQPLDLSKKSHFAGYLLEQRPEMDDLKPLDYTSETLESASSVGEPDSKPDHSVEKVKKFICTACYSHFDSIIELKQHQDEDHPNVECKCSYTQVEEEVTSAWFTRPNPIGLLNVCATQLPPISDSPKRTNKYTCTKCSKVFYKSTDLHEHITDCADPYRPRMMFVYYYPGKKNRHFFLPGAKGDMVKVEKGEKYKNNTVEPARKKKSTPPVATTPVSEPVVARSTTEEVVSGDDSQGAWSKQRSISMEDGVFDDDEQANGRKRRRKNFGYNPHKHIRRREMAEVIDVMKCTGCNENFGTISLLERHIPMCSHKHKINEHTAKMLDEQEIEEEEDEYDPKKHTCIYCLKQFTYFGMLRKHVFDICSVRKDLVEKGEYIDEEWEKDINVRAGVTSQVTFQRSLSRQSSVSSMNGIESLDTAENSSDSKPVRGRRRRRRGNGWYSNSKKAIMKGKKRESATNWEWEPYFVLDETFMGVYNNIADDDGGVSDEMEYDDGSNDSLSKVQSREGSQDSKADHQALEQMQTQKRALFDELTKSNSGNKVDSSLENEKQSGKKAEKQPNSSKSKKSSKVNKHKEDGVVDVKPKSSPSKKDKNKDSSAESLARVKQKLAKKIMESKKKQQTLLKVKTSPDKSKSSPMKKQTGKEPSSGKKNKKATAAPEKNMTVSPKKKNLKAKDDSVVEVATEKISPKKMSTSVANSSPKKKAAITKPLSLISPKKKKDVSESGKSPLKKKKDVSDSAKSPSKKSLSLNKNSYSPKKKNSQSFIEDTSGGVIKTSPTKKINTCATSDSPKKKKNTSMSLQKDPSNEQNNGILLSPERPTIDNVKQKTPKSLKYNKSLLSQMKNHKSASMNMSSALVKSAKYKRGGMSNSVFGRKRWSLEKKLEWLASADETIDSVAQSCAISDESDEDNIKLSDLKQTIEPSQIEQSPAEIQTLNSAENTSVQDVKSNILLTGKICDQFTKVKSPKIKKSALGRIPFKSAKINRFNVIKRKSDNTLKTSSSKNELLLPVTFKPDTVPDDIISQFEDADEQELDGSLSAGQGRGTISVRGRGRGRKPGSSFLHARSKSEPTQNHKSSIDQSIETKKGRGRGKKRAQILENGFNEEKVATKIPKLCDNECVADQYSDDCIDMNSPPKINQTLEVSLGEEDHE